MSGYKIFDFVRINLSKEYLRKLPEADLSFIAAFGLAANDISVFTKILIGCMHNEVREPELSDVLVIHHLVMRRNIYAKIFEFIKLFDRYAEKLIESSSKTNRKHGKS